MNHANKLHHAYIQREEILLQSQSHKRVSYLVQVISILFLPLQHYAIIERKKDAKVRLTTVTMHQDTIKRG
jgi:hypothetical protein